jgi:hypothetical protein
VQKDIVANWRLHHDNVPSHTSLLVHEFLAKHHVATLPQPPYSPDLAPVDFFLFKGRHFESIPAIQAVVTTALNEVPAEAFEGAYRAWEQTDLGCAVKLKAFPPPTQPVPACFDQQERGEKIYFMTFGTHLVHLCGVRSCDGVLQTDSFGINVGPEMAVWAVS